MQMHNEHQYLGANLNSAHFKSTQSHKERGTNWWIILTALLPSAALREHVLRANYLPPKLSASFLYGQTGLLYMSQCHFLIHNVP